MTVTLAELVDAAAGVHDLVLARVERVRGGRDVDLDQRVLVAVLPLHRLLGRHRGTGQKRKVRGDVLEDDVAVLGMDAGLHGMHHSGVRGARQYRDRPGHVQAM